METALAMVALVFVTALCAVGIAAVTAQVRCVDAAREAARLAARGDETADATARTVAPVGAAVHIRHHGGFVTATVTVRSWLLPGIALTGNAVAAAEPTE